MNFSTIARLSLKILTLTGSILLLLSCAYATVWNTAISFFDLLTLVLPYLVIVNFVLGFGASLCRSKVLFFPLIALIIWFMTLGPFVVISSEGNAARDKDITVLSYNVLEFIGSYRYRPGGIDIKITDFVLEQDPEVVCFQEFAFTREVRSKMKIYPYEYRYSSGEKSRYSPMAIFSKYPIISGGSLDFQNSINNAIFSDLVVAEDTLRVYNVHLESLRFMPGSIKRENPLQLYSRLSKNIGKQKEQVELVYEHSRNSPYPYIICGDFNNTQYSRIYRRLKRGMKDTYLEKGSGLGTTLLFKFLPFRIDYILVDPELEITEHQNFEVDYSDHFPVKASFRFPGR